MSMTAVSLLAPANLPLSLDDSLKSLLTIQNAEESAWRDDAICSQIDPELFFPESEFSGTKKQKRLEAKRRQASLKDAKAICAQCPVRTKCLEQALANDEPFGVWGGMTQLERRRYKSRPHSD